MSARRTVPLALLALVAGCTPELRDLPLEPGWTRVEVDSLFRFALPPGFEPAPLPDSVAARSIRAGRFSRGRVTLEYRYAHSSRLPLRAVRPPESAMRRDVVNGHEVELSRAPAPPGGQTTIHAVYLAQRYGLRSRGAIPGQYTEIGVLVWVRCPPLAPCDDVEPVLRSLQLYPMTWSPFTDPWAPHAREEQRREGER